MRTTIRIADALYRRTKAEAASTGRTVSAVIEDSIRLALRRGSNADALDVPDLPVYGGSGVRPGVDLSDPSALRDLMDDEALEGRR